MGVLQSDALVFFGAPGDLAYKKIFPALQYLVKRGRLTVPVDSPVALLKAVRVERHFHMDQPVTLLV